MKRLYRFKRLVRFAHEFDNTSYNDILSKVEDYKEELQELLKSPEIKFFKKFSTKSNNKYKLQLSKNIIEDGNKFQKNISDTISNLTQLNTYKNELSMNQNNDLLKKIRDNFNKYNNDYKQIIEQSKKLPKLIRDDLLNKQIINKYEAPCKAYINKFKNVLDKKDIPKDILQKNQSDIKNINQKINEYFDKIQNAEDVTNIENSIEQYIEYCKNTNTEMGNRFKNIYKYKDKKQSNENQNSNNKENKNNSENDVNNEEDKELEKDLDDKEPPKKDKSINKIVKKIYKQREDCVQVLDNYIDYCKKNIPRQLSKAEELKEDYLSQINDIIDKTNNDDNATYKQFKDTLTDLQNLYTTFNKEIQKIKSQQETNRSRKNIDTTFKNQMKIINENLNKYQEITNIESVNEEIKQWYSELQDTIKSLDNDFNKTTNHNKKLSLYDDATDFTKEIKNFVDAVSSLKDDIEKVKKSINK